MNANQHLKAAIDCLAERGKQYDSPGGERSMDATVDAFEAVTGHSLTVTQGWLFMALLKAVRTQQGEHKADSFIDGAAYFALAGESAAQAAPIDWDAAEKRMEEVGQNGNDGAVYPIAQIAGKNYTLPSWAEWLAGNPDGSVYALENRPARNDTGRWQPMTGRFTLVCHVENHEHRIPDLFKLCDDGIYRQLK